MEFDTNPATKRLNKQKKKETYILQLTSEV